MEPHPDRPDNCQCAHAPMGLACNPCIQAGFNTPKEGVVQNKRYK
jgi:hypothetical protein